jgi:hypothetical protein
MLLWNLQSLVLSKRKFLFVGFIFVLFCFLCIRNEAWSSVSILKIDPNELIDCFDVFARKFCLVFRFSSFFDSSFVSYSENGSEVLTPVMKATRMICIGSPWGILSPHSFLNCVCGGVISNFTAKQNLFLVDSTNFPGMEGGGVFSIDNSGSFVGVSVFINFISKFFFCCFKIDDFAVIAKNR